MHLFLVGAGHVGLVTAVGLARLGHRITVADIDATRIDGLRAGRSPIFEPGLEEGIAAAGERIDFTTDLRPPAGAGFSFVAVGTPFGPDGPLALDHVEQVVGSLLDATGPEHAIVVRSTLPMSGPTELIELRNARRGEAAIVTNPEFMREGTALLDFAKPGRIVAGWLEERDRRAAERVLQLYAGIDAPTLAADARSVALIKLASNGFLAMKIAYANELARLSDAFGATASVVSDGLGLDERIGRSFLDAGPGFGGSCLPEQAVALAGIADGADVPAPLIQAIAVSNGVHQRAIVARLASLLGPGDLYGRRIAIFGLAFKANTDDVRQSPALALAAELRAAGAEVAGTDPRANAEARAADSLLAVADSTLGAAEDADAILVATEWPEYGTLDWGPIAAAMRGELVYDTRGIVDRKAAVAAGLRVVGLGFGAEVQKAVAR
jgi:UDPglucose 6-dehydrogenase